MAIAQCAGLAAANAADQRHVVTGQGASSNVDVQARRNRNAVEVRISTVVTAPIDIIWKVLTDYQRIPEFIPGFVSSEVLERVGDRALVKQRGAAHFLWFSFPIDIIVEAIEEYPNWVQVEKRSGNLVQLSGRYELQSVPPVTEARGARTAYLLRWTGVIEPEMELPPLVGRMALSQNLEQQFRALVAEIERRRLTGD